MKRDEAINRILACDELKNEAVNSVLGVSSKKMSKTPVTRDNIIMIIELLFGKEREMTREDALRFMRSKGVNISRASLDKIVSSLIDSGFKLGALVGYTVKTKGDAFQDGMTWGKFKVMPNGDPIPKEFLR